MLRLMGFALAGIALLLSVPAAAQHEIQQPKGKWQQPKEIQKPRDTWQQPGAIQVPKGIQAIRTEEEKCARRFVIGADTLFEFDQATLTPDAEETLKALASLLLEAVRAGAYPASVEGHTDAKGSDAYNQTLSERRAQTGAPSLKPVSNLESVRRLATDDVGQRPDTQRRKRGHESGGSSGY